MSEIFLSEETIELGFHQKDGVIGCRVSQRAGSIEQWVDKIVKVVNGFVQFSIWFVVPFESISVRYKQQH